MGNLSIFGPAVNEVSIKSNSTTDTVVDGLENLLTELELTRQGHEEWLWGDEV